MIIDHIYIAFLNQVKNCGDIDMRTSYEVADAMRRELSETCPEVIWQQDGSVAYNFIQSLCLTAKSDLLGLDPRQFTSGEIFIDAVCKARKAVLPGVRCDVH